MWMIWFGLLCLISGWKVVNMAVFSGKPSSTGDFCRQPRTCRSCRSQSMKLPVCRLPRFHPVLATRESSLVTRDIPRGGGGCVALYLYATKSRHLKTITVLCLGTFITRRPEGKKTSFPARFKTALLYPWGVFQRTIDTATKLPYS